jgi:hypothetical protein
MRYPETPDRMPGDPLEEQQRLLDNVALSFSLLSGRALPSALRAI